MSSFFALPVCRTSGVRVSHEEVINQLDDETVYYNVQLGVSDYFEDISNVSIKVEIAHYETAIALLKYLVYGAEFDENRYIIRDKKIPYSSRLLTLSVQQVESHSGKDTTITSRIEKRRGQCT